MLAEAFHMVETPCGFVVLCSSVVEILKGAFMSMCILCGPPEASETLLTGSQGVLGIKLKPTLLLPLGLILKHF